MKPETTDSLPLREGRGGSPKSTNWQFLLSQADDQLADLPEILKILKDTWRTYAPSLPPFTLPPAFVAINGGVPSPLPPGAQHAPSHFFFFFS